MSTINIITPLEDTPFILQLGEKYSTTLKKDEDLTLTIINPNQAKVSCTVQSGAGEVSLYKNGTRLLSLEQTYSLSTEPGYPTTVHLNTNVTPNEDTERVIVVSNESKQSIRARIARQYGVRGEEIEITGSKKKQVAIPDSVWELYIVALGPDQNTFEVELLTEED